MSIVCRISNKLEISGLSNGLIKKLEEFCSYTIFIDDVPTTLSYFERKKDYVVVPRGCLWAIQDLVESQKKKIKIELKTAKGSSINLKIDKKVNYTSGPFHYQGRVVNDLQNFYTTRLESPTGSGKTTMACLHAALVGKGPVLFLADQDRLVEQFVKTAIKVLGLKREDIGVIKAKKFSIKPITVGSLKTLAGDNFDLKAIRDKFYTVYFDECHISSAVTYRQVIMGLAPTYLIGLSATPEHYSSDSLNRLMEGLLGPVGVTVSPEEIPGRINPKIEIVKTGLSFPFKALEDAPVLWKRKCQHKMQKDIALNQTRNMIICNDTQRLVKEGHKVLIAVQRVFHGEILKNELEKRGLKVSFPYKTVTRTKDDKEVEQELVDHKQLDADVEAIIDGKIDVQIGTYKLFAKGYDCQVLSALQIAGPFSGINSTMVIQVVGRIQRHYFGKAGAVVYDYHDTSYPNNILGIWANDRENCLLSNFGV